MVQKRKTVEKYKHYTYTDSNFCNIVFAQKLLISYNDLVSLLEISLVGSTCRAWL